MLLLPTREHQQAWKLVFIILALAVPLGVSGFSASSITGRFYSISRQKNNRQQRPPPLYLSGATEGDIAAWRKRAERLRSEVQDLEKEHVVEKLEDIQRQLQKQQTLRDDDDDVVQRDLLQKQQAMLTKRLNTTQSSTQVASGESTSTASDGSSAATTTSLQPFSPFPSHEMDLLFKLANSGSWNEEQNMSIDTVKAFEMEVNRQRLQRSFQDPLLLFQEQEQLKTKYMQSTSSAEKKAIKRKWDQLVAKQQQQRPETVQSTHITPLSDTEIERRVRIVKDLPIILQALFRYRYTCKHEDAFLSPLDLQILIHHYSPKLDTLETDDEFHQLPDRIQSHFGGSFATFRKSYSSPAPSINVIFQPSNAFLDSSQSLEFIDRSRYLKEFYPIDDAKEAIMMTLLRSTNRTKNDDTKQLNDFLKGISYTARDPVMGGLFLRGVSKTNIDRMLLRSRHEYSAYWIPDPSPLTDEMIESGSDAEPVVYITNQSFDRVGKPLTQVSVSILALITTAIFAVFGANNMVDSVVVATVDDIVLVAAGLVFIQVVHELGHRMVAWKDSLDIGWPTLIPSPVLGLQGAITALRSSPPDLKSMFDFGMAGPLSGLLVSLLMLLQGLEWTTASYWTASPTSTVATTSLTVSVLHASQLGGSLVELFLGNGMLSMEQVSRISLHPIAVAGYCGLLLNAAALLPIGNTDGGRISIALFGRRGAYIVSKFTTVLMCLSGFVGLDDSGFLLTYALFCVIWQKNMELPARDEVTKLDTARALFGFLIAPLVVVALLPSL